MPSISFESCLRAALLGLPAMALTAQTTPPQAARTYVAAHQPQLLQGFEDFLAIPNVAADPASLHKNADYLVAQLQQRGVAARLLTAPGLPAAVPPVVYGELRTPGAKRTIVFYAHYDGQPVTPAEWTTGAPFTPVMKQVDGEPRVYARGAGDDKAAIFAQLTALSALQAAHVPLQPTSASSGRARRRPAPRTSNRS